MLGLRINSITNTNKLQVNIPDELIGVELQIIILPAIEENDQKIEFFTESELQKMHSYQSKTLLDDNEDYSKW